MSRACCWRARRHGGTRSRCGPHWAPPGAASCGSCWPRAWSSAGWAWPSASARQRGARLSGSARAAGHAALRSTDARSSNAGVHDDRVADGWRAVRAGAGHSRDDARVGLGLESQRTWSDGLERASGRAGGGPGRDDTRSLLVVAGLLMQSLYRLRYADVGFRPDGVHHPSHRAAIRQVRHACASHRVLRRRPRARHSAAWCARRGLHDVGPAGLERRHDGLRHRRPARRIPT